MVKGSRLMEIEAGSKEYLRADDKNMIEESQNIEHKEIWRDEYLKWICGFANAQGGRVYIGVDDDRQVTGFAVGTGGTRCWRLL